jgi:hypothetical protein
MLKKLFKIINYSELGYVDLGTAGYVIQLAIAFVLGGLVTLKIYWRKIKNWFRRNNDDKQ